MSKNNSENELLNENDMESLNMEPIQSPQFDHFELGSVFNTEQNDNEHVLLSRDKHEECKLHLNDRRNHVCIPGWVPTPEKIPITAETEEMVKSHFPSQSQFANHKHHCPDCNKSYKKRCSLISHLRKHVHFFI